MATSIPAKLRRIAYIDNYVAGLLQEREALERRVLDAYPDGRHLVPVADDKMSVHVWRDGQDFRHVDVQYEEET